MKKYLGIMLVLLVGSGFVCLTHARERHGQRSLPPKVLQQEPRRSLQAGRKVVFHLDWDQEERLTLAMENIKNLFKEITPQMCRVCVVANGKAVKLFHKDNIGEHAADIEELHKLGVRLMVSGNALAKNHIEKSDLFPLCDIIPAGILELINLQTLGYAYIKP
ncbi:MAG: DsrE family protein [Desulfomonilaceae bacterium]